MKKLYYSISEICSIVDEEQHILRYWEKEFDGLHPKKNRGGNRIYSEKDLNIVKVVKILLREEMLSLKGAKEQLEKILKNNLVLDYIANHKDKSIESSYLTTQLTKKESFVKIDKKLLIEMKDTIKETIDYLKSI